MGKVRLKFDYGGFNELRTQPAVAAALKAEALAIAQRAASASGLTAGEGDDVDFAVVESNRKTRARYVVIARTRQARVAEARDGVLTAALRG